MNQQILEQKKQLVEEITEKIKEKLKNPDVNVG